MEIRAINDLSNKWIEENINAAYFRGIKQFLKEGGDVGEASDRVGAFLQYGMDLTRKELDQIGEFYEMNEREMKTALITRLKDEVSRAKAALEEREDDELKRLLSYVDDTYGNADENGLDAFSCELLIGKLRRRTL